METVVMNIDGCDIEHEAPMIEEYSEEVMYAGWNPQLTLAGRSPIAQVNRHVNVLGDLAGVDVEAFLKKMYEYQG